MRRFFECLTYPRPWSKCMRYGSGSINVKYSIWCLSMLPITDNNVILYFQHLLIPKTTHYRDDGIKQLSLCPYRPVPLDFPHPSSNTQCLKKELLIMVLTYLLGNRKCTCLSYREVICQSCISISSVLFLRNTSDCPPISSSFFGCTIFCKDCKISSSEIRRTRASTLQSSLQLGPEFRILRVPCRSSIYNRPPCTCCQL